MRVLLAAILLITALAGCSTSDFSSFVIDGNKDTSLSLSRERNFLWDDWTPYLVVTHLPTCQRRYALKTVASDLAFKVELYKAGGGGYILRQGKRWYVTDINSCQFQQFKDPPPEPGDLQGAFIEKDGVLQFKAVSAENAATSAAAGQ